MSQTHRFFRLLVALLVVGGIRPAFAFEFNYQIRTDGVINAIQRDPADGTVYFGGRFSKVFKPRSEFFAGFDSETGDWLTSTAFPQIGGSVTAVIPDGEGGWYVAGNARQLTVNGSAKRDLAHIRADGTLDPWDPVFRYTVAQPMGGNQADEPARITDLLLVGDTLYVAGAFYKVNGETRVGIAAFDRNTGQLLPFTAPIRLQNVVWFSYVWDLEIKDSILYACGDGVSLSSSNEAANVLALDPVTGAVLHSSKTIYGQAIALLDDTVFVASSNNVSSLNAANVGETIWSVSSNAVISPYSRATAISVIDEVLYVGGQFSAIAGVARVGLAALDLETGAVLPTFATSPLRSAAGVSSLKLIGQTLYVGGEGLDFGDDAPVAAGAIDLTTQQSVGWFPIRSGQVTAISEADGTIYLGGTLTVPDEVQPRRGLAAISSAGELLPWNPDVSGHVNALALAGSELVVGGKFDKIGETPRTNLATFDLATGTLTDWNPAPNGQIFDVNGTQDAIYVGGEFSLFSGQATGPVAAVHRATRGLLWTATGLPNEFRVENLARTSTRIYVSGNLVSEAGEQPASDALDLANGTRLGWTDGKPGPLTAQGNLLLGFEKRPSSVSVVLFDGQSGSELRAFTTSVEGGNDLAMVGSLACLVADRGQFTFVDLESGGMNGFSINLWGDLTAVTIDNAQITLIGIDPDSGYYVGALDTDSIPKPTPPPLSPSPSPTPTPHPTPISVFPTPIAPGTTFSMVSPAKIVTRNSRARIVGALNRLIEPSAVLEYSVRTGADRFLRTKGSGSKWRIPLRNLKPGVTRVVIRATSDGVSRKVATVRVRRK